MDLELNSNKAWFPGLWISTYCSHEILWVLKIMDWLSRTEILVVLNCEVSKTHILVYCYSEIAWFCWLVDINVFMYIHMCVCVCVCVLVTQSYLTLWYPMDCNLSGSSVHGIPQARTREWIAICFCRVSSLPGEQTPVSWTSGRFFTVWATGKSYITQILAQFIELFCLFCFY